VRIDEGCDRVNDYIHHSCNISNPRNARRYRFKNPSRTIETIVIFNDQNY